MDDTIGFGDSERRSSAGTRLLVPMDVEGATVWIEQYGPTAVIDGGDEIYTAGLDPGEAFAKAIEIVRGALSGVARQIVELGESARPNELTIEFALSFEVEGRASIIPVLLTGASTMSSGIKVSAVWRWAERNLGHDPS